MNKKILIVEDDPIARRLLHSALHAQQFTTILAADAMGALTQARTEHPDLIVLDLGLPAGGGFDFLTRLKRFPGLDVIPVIVVSGMERAANEPRALAEGAVAYLEKPVLPELLVENVKRVLGAA